MTLNNLWLLRKAYNRPTSSQAVVEAVKDYLLHEPERSKMTPEGEKVEMKLTAGAIVAIAEKDVEAEAKDRNSA